VSTVLSQQKTCYVAVKTGDTKVYTKERLVTKNSSEEYAEFKKPHLLISRLDF
jgi:hypothetical protein